MSSDSPALARTLSPARAFPTVGMIYAVSLGIAMGLWLLPLRAPLWLDETVTYWQIHGGLSQIWVRASGSFPGYLYILWAYTKIIGTSELAMRIPSLIAMAAAAYVLYRCARELLPQHAALLATVVFCLHPVVVYAAVDVRQYAFGVLAMNCAAWAVLRWWRAGSPRRATVAGIACASIFYFHTLFGLVLVPFALFFAITKRAHWRAFLRELPYALLPFLMLMVPVVPRFFRLARTAEQHIFAPPAEWRDLFQTLAPGYLIWVATAVLLFAFAHWLFIRRNQNAALPDTGPLVRGAWLLPMLMAFVPLLILFTLSWLTPLHLFILRYRLGCVPGIALCWGLLFTQLRWKPLAPLFCVGAVAVSLVGITSNERAAHGYTWKYALQAAEGNTAGDHAPLLVCNDLPESNFVELRLLTPLEYYKVSSPVVPLPRAWNVQAALEVRRFLATATPKHQRFLLLAFEGSWPSIRWITGMTKNTYTPHLLGNYDGVKVVEFVPM